MPGDSSFINRIRSQFRRTIGRSEHVLSRSLLERGSAQPEPRAPRPAPSRSWVKPPHVAWRRLLSWGQGNAPVHGGYEQSPYAFREESPFGPGANWKNIAYVLTVLLVVVSGLFAYVLMNRGDRSNPSDDNSSPMLALQTATGVIASDGTHLPASAPAVTAAIAPAHRSTHPAPQSHARPAAVPPVQANVPAQPDTKPVAAQAPVSVAQNPVTQPYQPQAQPQPYQPPQQTQQVQQTQQDPLNQTPYQQAQQYQQQYAQNPQPQQAQPAPQGQPNQQLAMQNPQAEQNQQWRRTERVPKPPEAKAADESQQASAHVAYDLRVARASLDKDNLGAARAALGRVLNAQPHNADALAMHADLESREFQRDSILAAARSCIAQDQWTCVWRDAGKALVIDASSNEAKTMLTQAMTQSELDQRTGATRVPRPPGAP